MRWILNACHRVHEIVVEIWARSSRELRDQSCCRSSKVPGRRCLDFVNFDRFLLRHQQTQQMSCHRQAHIHDPWIVGLRCGYLGLVRRFQTMYAMKFSSPNTSFMSKRRFCTSLSSMLTKMIAIFAKQLPCQTQPRKQHVEPIGVKTPTRILDWTGEYLPHRPDRCVASMLPAVR